MPHVDIEKVIFVVQILCILEFVVPLVVVAIHLYHRTISEWFLATIYSLHSCCFELKNFTVKKLDQFVYKTLHY